MLSQVSKADSGVYASRDGCHTCVIRGVNYYRVLSLERHCNDTEIKQAYRRCATRYNPAREKNGGAEAIFALAAEAYDVLSDPLRRAVYDQYGEEGLKNGVPTPEGFAKPYVYHGEPMRIFREFFANETPYDDLLNVLREPQSLFEFPEGRGIKRKEEPLMKILFLTLSEVFFGGIKKIKIQKLLLTGDDKSTTVSTDKILTVPIKPGIPSGTRIIFVEQGDQGATKIPADVILVTQDRPHEIFRREGSHLRTTVDIFLSEALTGTVITLSTIDGRILRIPITSIVTYAYFFQIGLRETISVKQLPDYTKRLPGEGMPLPANPTQRGDLILGFNIEFPVYMPISNKSHIKRAFKVPSRTTSVDRFISANKVRRNVDEDVSLRRDRRNDKADRKVTCDA